VHSGISIDLSIQLPQSLFQLLVRQNETGESYSDYIDQLTGILNPFLSMS